MDFIVSTIKESLQVSMYSFTEQEYVGGTECGNMYKDYHKVTVQVLLDGEVISETTDTIG